MLNLTEGNIKHSRKENVHTASHLNIKARIPICIMGAKLYKGVVKVMGRLPLEDLSCYWTI